MNILTIGNGFVANHLSYKIINEKLNANNIKNMINNYHPDVLINAIGFCGNPNVDQCELEKVKTYTTNTIIPILLAEECAKRDIHLIHIGSGCIFYGQSPNIFYGRNVYDDPIVVDLGWKEKDFANPESFYSKTKYAADLILEGMPNVTVLRIRMPISSKNLERNLISKLRKYDKVIDIPNSVTFMDDFVNCVDWVIKNRVTGIYHVTNPQTLTAAEIMREYLKYVPDHKFRIINEQELGSLTVAKRSNCLLNTEKLSNAGFQMTLAKDALKNCMSEYIKNI